MGEIILVDTDKPSLQVKLRLSPDKVSKEALATDVTVLGRLDGALAPGQTLSAPLRQINGSVTEGRAGRDADYNIDLSTLTIPRRKPNGSTTITVIPKNAGAGTLGIGTLAELRIKGTDINQDGDTRDTYPASVGEATDGIAPGEARTGTIQISEAALNEDLNGSGTLEDDVYVVVQEAADYNPENPDDEDDGPENPEFDDAFVSNAKPYSNANDPNGNSYFAFREATVVVPTLPNATTGWDLNGNGTKDDIIKVVTEKALRHLLVIEAVDFTIEGTPIAASKGLKATRVKSASPLLGRRKSRARCRSSWILR